MRTAIRTAAAGLAAAWSAAAWAGPFSGGREVEPGRDFQVRVTAGQVLDVQVMVQETTRKLYDVTGSYWKQLDAENYDLNDFGMDGGYALLGLSLEKVWRHFTLQIDAAVMQPDTDTVARRNYYIEVGDDIEYGGREYDQMKIPEGTPFSLDMTAATLEVRGMFTPFTLRLGQSFRFVPWLDLGLFGALGEYDIDAGPPQGVTQYQDPPEDFVIGGKASGFAGLGLPELGVGAEWRLGAAGGTQLVVQGRAGFCSYDGSTKYLTLNDHREKNADVEHVNLKCRAALEFPLAGSRALTLGVHYQVVESEALISSTADTVEEVLAEQERFDKEAEFRLESLQAVVGLTF